MKNIVVIVNRIFGDEPIIGRYISYLSIFTFALINQNFEIKKTTILFIRNLFNDM